MSSGERDGVIEWVQRGSDDDDHRGHGCGPWRDVGPPPSPLMNRSDGTRGTCSAWEVTWLVTTGRLAPRVGPFPARDGRR